MFTDEAIVEFTGGHGGPGKVSFHKPPVRGPDGGNGGKGADIYLRSSDSVTTLAYFSKHPLVKAVNGEHGGSNRKSGKNGPDLVIEIPTSTEMTDLDSGEKIEFPKPGIMIKICIGGLGGRGNYEFRSPRNTTPEYAQPGLAGQIRKVKIQIKLIADLGLIGLPNSGKSSLLNELTSAEAKTGNYPFTTLEPNLGVYQKSVKKKIIIADIPGIIEGAGEGKGLGVKFLKHIEKVKMLLHCVPCDSLDPLGDYHVIRRELAAFSPKLTRKKEIILLTKSDLVEETGLKLLEDELKSLGKQIIAVSVYNFDSIENLKACL